MSDDSTRIKTLEKARGLHYNGFPISAPCNDSAFAPTRHRKSPKTRPSWESRAKLLVSKRYFARGLPLLRDELNRAGDARFLPRFLPLLGELVLGELAACFGEAD